jgi:hypothetical protein
MARNRIIYNVEGLYVAPYSGEQNANSDYYLANNIILKRLEKIQNFNYSIQQPRSNAQGFGQKQNIFRGVSGPPEVTFNFSYIPDGVTNENRLNFNVNNFSGFNAPMFSGLCTNSGLLNNRDFYLVINKNENDLFSENATLTSSLINPTNVTQVINSNSQNYGLLHFQNSYLNEYSFNVSLGNLPVVNQSYIADNIVFYNSGSGVKYTSLDLRSGINQVNNDTIIIPKALNYNQTAISGQNILLPGDASVTFYRTAAKTSNNIISLIPENIFPQANFTPLVGNTFTKIAGVNLSWNSQAYSSIGYNNNMFVEATSNVVLNKNVMFGLNSDPTLNSNYTNLDYAFYFNDNGYLYINEGGLDLGAFAPFTTSTKARIEYDGKNVNYFIDGVVVRSLNVPIQNQTYYFDSSFYNFGASINANYGTLSNIQYYNDTIQSLDYSLSFNRKPYRAINYKFPLLRKMEFPVNGKLNTSFIVKEDFEGSFFDTLNRDDDYNVVVDFSNSRKGVDKTKLTFSGCKFTNINYDSSIGSNKTATLSFDFDLDPDFGRRGLFVSGNVLYGVLNNQKKVLIF